MRTIKFRGKRVDNNEWVYGDLVHNAFDGTSKTIPVAIKTDGMHPVEVHPETVGQFANCKDKNGKDIYEHDFIKGGIYSCYDVLFDHEENRINVLPKNSRHFEVIGNRHDNPELL